MTTNFWNKDIDGNWATPADWSTGALPVSTDDVTISTADFHTVTYSTGAYSIHSLTVGGDAFVVSGGTLTIAAGATFGNVLTVSGGTLTLGTAATVAGLFTQSGKSIVSGAATLTLSGGASFAAGLYALQTGAGTTVLKGVSTDAASLALDGGRVLDNQGVFNWTGGASIALGYNPAGASVGGGTIENDAGANFNIEIDAPITANAGVTAFTNAGTLTKSVTSGTTNIDAPFTNTGTVSVTTGTIEFDGGGSFGGTISGAGTAAFGSGGKDTINAGATLSVANLLIDGATLQITPSLTYKGRFSETGGDLNLAAGSVLTLAAANFSGGTIDGAGTLITGGATAITGSNVTLGSTAWTNSGVLTVAGGLSGITFGGAGITWANAGTIAATGDAITFGGTWTTQGALAITNSTLNFNGVFAASALDQLAGKGDAITIGSTGVVNNAGGSIAVGSASAGTGLTPITLSGVINGGTIVDAGDGFIFEGGALNGVTYRGTLDLSSTAYNPQLTITGGLTVTGAGGTGPGVIQDTGAGSTLIFQNSQTIDNATINIGNANVFYSDTLYLYDLPGTGQTLTLGKNLVIKQTGAYADLTSANGAGDAIVNNGAIDIGVAGGAFTINPAIFTNQGTIAVSNGATLALQPTSFANAGTITITGDSTAYIGSGFVNTGAISVASGSTIDFQAGVTTAQLGAISAAPGTVEIDGTLNNAGATLTVGTGTALGTIALTGAIQGGVISDAGDGVAFGGGATLDGVTYEGVLDLPSSGDGAEVTIADGLTITGAGGVGPGVIQDTGGGDSLIFQNGQTIDNATINIGNNGGDDILLYDPSGAGQTLVLGAGLTIRQVGAAASLTSAGSSLDTIVNGGAIDAVAPHGALTINPGMFTNQGAITVSNGSTLDLQPSVFTNLAGGALAGGSYEVDAGSVLELAQNAAIVTDDATITLSGLGSVIEDYSSALKKEVGIEASLTAIGASGVLDIVGGRSWTTTLAMSNAGILRLGGGTLTALRLTQSAGSLLVGYGAIANPIINAGTIQASQGVLSIEKTVTGTGGFQIDANATLSLATAVANTAAISFEGAGAILALAAPSRFTGVLSGIVAGDKIDLVKTVAAAVTLNASDQLVATTAKGVVVATLNLGAGSGDCDYSAVSDGNGGTFLVASADQPPFTTVPGAQTVQAAKAVAIGGVSVADGDATAYHETITVVLSDSTGLLSASAVTGATVAGAGTTTLTLSGTLAAVNAELNSLTYTGASASAPSTDVIDVAASDGRGGGDNHTIQVTVSRASASWNAAASADWSLATAWSGGFVPHDAGTDVTIAAAGSAYTVGLAAAETYAVHNLTINAAAATLGVAGSLTVSGALTLSAGVVQLTSGAALSGSAALAAGTKLIGAGVVSGALQNLGTIEASGGLLKIAGALSGTAGVLSIDNGATLELGGAVAGQTIGFASGAKAVLKIDSAPAMSAGVNGFVAGDTIDIAAATVTSDSYAAGVLTLFNGATALASLSIAGTFAGQIFALSSDGKGGTDIALAADGPPAVSAPSTATVAVNAATPIAGISIADADAAAANQTISVTITDKTGKLSASSAGGGAVTGTGSAKLAITGSLAQVDADLKTLTYTGPATGTDTVTIAASDGDGGTGSKTIAVTVVTHLSQPPLFAAEQPRTVAGGSENGLPNLHPALALFAQYAAAGFGARSDGAGDSLHVIPATAQHWDLAARH
jgi:hypothetical protein